MVVGFTGGLVGTTVNHRCYAELNNFGALRLFFAVLVILSHSFELVDGDRSREILTRLFGTLSFGELGVDGFFLISGYLVTKSFQESHSTGEYLLKRILRIYPGYAVAYLLCIFALGPFVGGQIASLPGIKVLTHMGALQTPVMEGVFADTPPYLNNSMWTIAYEFRCYLLVPVAGLAGLLSKRSILFALTIACLALSATRPDIWNWFPYQFVSYLGAPSVSLRFTGIFGCGALFYLYRDHIRYDWRLATSTTCGLIALLFSRHFAEPALAILGGYLLFWFSFNVRSARLASVGHKVDISYGVYLYAWPVQKLLIWLYPGISPWLVFIETMAIASVLALGSWWLVEKPFLRLKAVLVAAPGTGLRFALVGRVG